MAGENRQHEDILRIMGFIGFVSILVGSAVAVFDAGLWLRTSDTYTNAMTYTMGAFTLQGMSYFFYKLLMQEGMDTKAQWTKSQRVRDRSIQQMNDQFADAQLQQELRARQLAMERQLRVLDENPEAYLQMMNGGVSGLNIGAIPFTEPTTEFNPPPKHKSEPDKPLTLGTDITKKKDGSPDKRFKKDKVEAQ
tara:strand:+ start:9056 stop:9634 length:579 start_codon:yes stop_codon:yes gene_type:complete